MKITVEGVVKADPQVVWNAWNTPKDIMKWNTASDDWHTTSSTVDLRVGGKMSNRMEAKDGSMGFDFAATFTVVEAPTRLAFRLDDDRIVEVTFEPTVEGVHVVETFDAESENPVGVQEKGWQAIMDNFVRHVESKR